MLKSTNQARNLGVIMDSELIRSVMKSADYQLKNTTRIKGLMCQSGSEKLLQEFISSRPDDWNRVFPGVSKR